MILTATSLLVHTIGSQISGGISKSDSRSVRSVRTITYSAKSAIIVTAAQKKNLATVTIKNGVSIVGISEPVSVDVAMLK